MPLFERCVKETESVAVYLRFLKKSGEVKLLQESQMKSIRNEIMILKSDLNGLLLMIQHSVSIKEAF